MVSIHIVPVIVCLIIKVISSTFRFKREASELSPAPRSEAPRNVPCLSKRATQKPTPRGITIHYTDSSIGARIHQWLSRHRGYVYSTPTGHLPLLCF